MRRTTVALSLLLSLLLSGCAGQGKEASASSYVLAMDTVMDLTAYGPEAQAALTEAEAVLDRLEGLLSVTDPESEVWAINHSGGQPVAVSPDTAALLDLGLTLGTRTGGALDISVYPVVLAWGFTTDHYQVPGETELEQARSKVDYAAIAWDGTSVTLPDGMELDFGSVAKGYAGALLAQTMRDSGVTSAILNLGGNVQTVGAKPDGTPWRVGIKDPWNTEETLGVVTVEDEALVTSAGYERYFEEDGTTYWHIIDPATGYPADSGLCSVTVIGADGGMCDGLSTALFVMGLDEAADYWRDWGGFDAVFVTEDGSVFITEGLEQRFSLREGANMTLSVLRAK